MIVLARIVPSTSTPVTVTGIKGDVEGRIWALLGRTDLEEIIRAFDLYGEVRKRESLSAAVDRMRRDIRIESLGYRADGAAHAISVSFAAADAALAKQVTDRLASVLIEASLDQPTDRLDMTIRAFESRVAEMREQIIEHEARLAALRTENAGRPISEAELIPYEVLKEQYRNLLVRKLDAEVAENLERRQAGQQFRITDPARLPDSPDGPSRMRVTVIGALIGLLIGLALVVLRRSSDGAPPALAEA